MLFFIAGWLLIRHRLKSNHRSVFLSSANQAGCRDFTECLAPTTSIVVGEDVRTGVHLQQLLVVQKIVPVITAILLSTCSLPKWDRHLDASTIYGNAQSMYIVEFWGRWPSIAGRHQAVTVGYFRLISGQSIYDTSNGR